MPLNRSNTSPHHHSHTNRTHARLHQPSPWSSRTESKCCQEKGEPTAGPSEGRSLVLCFEGTNDKFDSTNSNVVRLFSMLAKGDPERQMVYYQAGIDSTKYIGSPWRRAIARSVDKMFATSVKGHIIDGYKFLMQNYRHNDKICMFGFGEGAYTALCLAGMLYKVGLLTAGNFQQIPLAYKLYCDDSVKGWSESLQFKRTFSLNVDIEFVGLWDTVEWSSRHLPLTRENPAIKTFRHAVALDEHRVEFTPLLYQSQSMQQRRTWLCDEKNPPEPSDNEKSEPCCEEEAFREDLFQRICAYNVMKEATAITKRFPGKFFNEEETVADTFDKLEEYYSNRPNATDVLEVWFAGCHRDVGGGCVSNSTKNSLANIPLRWMIRQCILANTGIIFDCNKLRSIGIDLDPVTGLPVPYPLCHPKDDNASPTLTRVDSQNDSAGLRWENGSPVLETHAYALNSNQHNQANVRGESSCSLETLAYAVDGSSYKEADARGTMSEDYLDAICPMYDQLEHNRHWWIIECLPVIKIDWQKNERKAARANFGRACFKTEESSLRNIKFHDSVRIRMEKLGYRPRLNIDDAMWVH